MGTLAAFLTLLAAPIHSAAQQCTPRELQQYRDELAAPDTGRIRVAFAYCNAKMLRDRMYRLGRGDAAQCDAEMSKARDALVRAGDTAALDFAMAGCRGELGPPPK